jgi:hypothetical protein
MFDRKILTDNDKFLIPTNTPPSQMPGDIDMDGKESQKWNIRTLTLMNRANLIKLDWQKPLTKANFDSQTFADTRNYRLSNIKNEHHLSKNTWETQVEPVRLQRQLWSRQNFKLMSEALRTNPRRCISEIFAEAYTIPSQEIPFAIKSISVSRACGGCNFCRRRKLEPFSGIMPVPIPVWQNPYFYTGQKFKHLFAKTNLILIFYDVVEQSKWEVQRHNLFRWLITQGIINVVTSKQQKDTFIQEANSSTFWFDINDYHPIKMPRVPTLIFYSPGDTLSYNPTNYNQAPCIILLPINTPDPSRSDRRLIDIFPGRSFKFESFCTEVGI